MPDISVIIPAFNAQPHIGQAVQSALAQTVSALEIVIAADDGEDYLSVLAAQGIRDAKIRCVSTGMVASGAARARNCALDNAGGTIIASLDADDRFSERYLERMTTDALTYGASISQVAFVDSETGQLLPNASKQYHAQALSLDDLLLACFHTCAGIVFDRRRITHLWNEQIPLLEDVIFLAECCHTLGKVWYADEPLYLYSHRQGSQCNRPDAPEQFIRAGRIIRELLEQNEVCVGDYPLQRVLLAYIEKNDRIERAFEKAWILGEARSYQEFIRQRPELAQQPLG